MLHDSKGRILSRVGNNNIRFIRGECADLEPIFCLKMNDQKVGCLQHCKTGQWFSVKRGRCELSSAKDNTTELRLFNTECSQGKALSSIY